MLEWLFSKLKKRARIEDPQQIHRNKMKYIVETLGKKNGELIELLPEEFKESFRSKSYISGGSIYSLYHDNEPKDFDFFVTSNELAEQLRNYFVDTSQYQGKSISGGLYNNQPLTVTENAISLGKYQIITQWVGSPEEVIGQFDFVHNMFYWQKGRLGTFSDWEYLKKKELVYNEFRARDIVGTIVRMPKFIQRGMTITQKEMSKVLLRLHEKGFNEKELEILHNGKLDRHFGS